MKHLVQLLVNGQAHDLVVHPTRTLLDVLRDDLGLTGAKKGCDLGACGACAVLLDGRPITACLTLAVEAVGHEILTIEGLGENGALHPVQEAFIALGAVQCGFCTPGLVLAAKALLDAQPDPAPEEIREALSGNVCRCTGYVKVIDAVAAAARTRNEASPRLLQATDAGRGLAPPATKEAQPCPSTRS